MSEEKNQKNKHYISAKESREIAKHNTETVRELQKKRAKYTRDDYVTNMRDPQNIVEFDDLHTYFFTDNGTVKAVNGVSFDIPQGSTVGVVGESGCGKSVTSLSLMQLVQGPMGQIVEGSIRFRSTVRKPVGKEPVMEEVVDFEGNTVLDADGNPVMRQARHGKGKLKFKTVKVPVDPEEGASSQAALSEETERQNSAEEAANIEDAAENTLAPEEIAEETSSAEENTEESKASEEEGPEEGDQEEKQAAEAPSEQKIAYKKVKQPVLIPALDEHDKPILRPDGSVVLEQAHMRKGKLRERTIFEEHEEVFDIAKMPPKDMYTIRGREIAMIFQEPMTSLNPVFTIGYQLDEVTLLHVNGADKEDAKKRSLEMLNLVGIAMPEHVYKSYPHQLSGGMRQRVMIAMALCCNPKLIIADEPTTALDVTIQAQILDLLRDVKDKISGSIMLITHDLGVIAEMVDYVVVMYAGRVVEKGTVREIFKNPLHPYTIGLQKSKPVVGKEVDRLYSIPGNVPNPINMLSTCYFKDRCNMKCAACKGDYPEMVQVSPTHFVACHRYKGIMNASAREEAPEAEAPIAAPETEQEAKEQENE